MHETLNPHYSAQDLGLSSGILPQSPAFILGKATEEAKIVRDPQPGNCIVLGELPATRGGFFCGQALAPVILSRSSSSFLIFVANSKTETKLDIKSLKKNRWAIRLHVPGGDPWIRDYFPMASKDLSGRRILYASGARETPALSSEENSRKHHRTNAQVAIASLLGLELRRLDFHFEIGNFTPIGDDAVCITRKVLGDNPNLSVQHIANECSRLGRPKLIIIPAIDATGHSDSAVVQVNDTVLVSNLTEDTGVYQKLSDKHYADIDQLKMNCNSIAAVLDNMGFKVRRVPIPFLRWDTNDDLQFSSPVNFIQHYNPRNGEIDIILPVAGSRWEGCVTKINGKNAAVTNHLYEEIKKVLREAGVGGFHSVVINDAVGGSLHCLSSFLPQEFLPESLKKIWRMHHNH